MCIHKESFDLGKVRVEIWWGVKEDKEKIPKVSGPRNVDFIVGVLEWDVESIRRSRWLSKVEFMELKIVGILLKT